MKITKQKLINSGILESSIHRDTCLKCGGLLIAKKSIMQYPIFTCVDCATAYKVKA